MITRLATPGTGFLLALAVLASLAVAKTDDYDPASLDLAALIECRADVSAYTGYALWLAGDPGAASTLGWKEVPSGNAFLRQYRLPAPTRVFGRETATIVFTASGPMAVLDGIAAADLARQRPGNGLVAGQVPWREGRCRKHRQHRRRQPFHAHHAQRLDRHFPSRQDTGRLLLPA